MNYVSSWYADTDDAEETTENKRKANISVGMCPLIAGEFVPFVHYLDINGKLEIPSLYLDSQYALNKDIEYSSMYFWSTCENGWAPG